MPSKNNHDELLRSPHLVRMTQALGSRGLELTLLVRGSSLHCKYLVSSEFIDLAVFKVRSGALCYAIVIPDDDVAPLMYWSVAESVEEIDSFHKMLFDRDVIIHLFNETCANVAWASTVAEIRPPVLAAISGSRHFEGNVQTLSDEAREGMTNARVSDAIIRLHVDKEWKKIYATYITDSIERCEIDLMGGVEGAQQEILARWLADGLSPKKIHLNPDLHEESGTKEFTDLIFSSANFTCVIMSKSLSLFSRKNMSRSSLKNATLKNLRDDVRKIRNQCIKLGNNVDIYESRHGPKIEGLCRTRFHAICLISDQDYINGEEDLFGRELLLDFEKRAHGRLHILDTTQMFRMVQAAQMLENKSAVERMEAFDTYMTKRFEFAVEKNVIDFDMTIHLTGDQPHIRFTF